MSCKTGSCSGDGCVKDTVRKIVDAQRQVAGVSTGLCVTSCDQSIEDLLSPSVERRPSRHTTIPFMLICKDSCRTFVGSGVTSRGSGGRRRDHFECVESPILRVRGFVRGSNSCVQLELLSPVHKRGDSDNCDDHGGGHNHGDKCSSSPCGHFDNKHIHNFRETGICITVDLDCFCGITCLDAITPIPF